MNSITSNALCANKVRSIFAESGISIAEWARAEGFSTALVYQVIEGKRQCVRGQSHRIAVALGLKSGVICDLAELRGRLAAVSVQSKDKDSAM